MSQLRRVTSAFQVIAKEIVSKQDHVHLEGTKASLGGMTRVIHGAPLPHYFIAAMHLFQKWRERDSPFNSYSTFSSNVSGQLVIMAGTETFPLAISSWPRDSKLNVISVIGTRIASFPMAFLQTCGDNSWSYVYFVISLLVEEDPEHPASLIDRRTGLSVVPDGIPHSGTFEYIEQGITSCSKKL